MTDPPTVQNAASQLLDLVTAMRPDWPKRDVRAVIAHAATIGMTWPETAVGLVRLATDRQAARPGELIPDHRDPRRRRRRDPDTARRGAQRARAALTRTQLEET